MKYKISSVVRSVQMFWVFSAQKLNSAIALLGTQTLKRSLEGKIHKQECSYNLFNETRANSCGRCNHILFVSALLSCWTDYRDNKREQLRHFEWVHKTYFS